MLPPVYQTPSVETLMHSITSVAEDSIYFTMKSNACMTAQICVHLYNSPTAARAASDFIGDPLTLLECRTVCAACLSVTASLS